MYLNNDVLSIIGDYADIQIINSKRKNNYLVALNCECCGKKTRYTENTYVERIVIPEGLIEINKEKITSHYRHIYKDTRDENVFGVVKIDGEVYDYKKYVLENGTLNKDDDNRDRYTIEWDKEPDNVKIYCDQSKSDYIINKLHDQLCSHCATYRHYNTHRRKSKKSFKEELEELTTISYETIVTKGITCYNCRKKKGVKRIVKYLQKPKS